jgi:zinc/manganese transport system substrate-binding protein
MTLMLIGAATIAPPTAAELRVVAATNDLGAIARAVGGDHMRIDVIARPDRNIHTLEIRPSAMRKTAKADFYLEVGMSLDIWSDGIVSGSRNRNLQVLDCSAAIAAPLEVPTGAVDASMGDVHPEGNPHYWLNPENGVLIAHFLGAEFGRADPERAAIYADNAGVFSEQIEQRMHRWEEALIGRRFIEYHRTWTYLADRFGMDIAAAVEPLPGIPPTARHLSALSTIINGTSIVGVVFDVYQDQSPLEFLERETGVRAIELPSSCSEPTPAAYIALFDQIAVALGSGAK